MADLVTTPASVALDEVDLLGPLEPSGPRAGADVGTPMTHCQPRLACRPLVEAT